MAMVVLFASVFANAGNSRPIGKFARAEAGKNGKTETSILKLLGYITGVLGAVS